MVMNDCINDHVEKNNPSHLQSDPLFLKMNLSKYFERYRETELSPSNILWESSMGENNFLAKSIEWELMYESLIVWYRSFNAYG